MTFQTPSIIRDTLLPELFLESARLNADHPFAYLLDDSSPNSSSQIECITWNQYVKHAAFVAANLAKDIPPRTSGEPKRVVGVYARSRYSYAVHCLAFQLNGWTACLISTKNSPDAIRHLLNVSQSTHFIIDESYLGFAESLATGIPVVTFQPLLEGDLDLVTSKFASITDEQRAHDLDIPAFYLHTSGSTGHPKIIPLSHRHFSQWANGILTIAPAARDQTLYCSSPLFHAMGASVHFLLSSTVGTTNLFVDMKRPATGDTTLHHLSTYYNFLHSNPSTESKGIVFFGIPFVLYDIVASGDEAIKQLAKFTQVVVYSGAGLSDATGEVLVQHGVNVRSGYGMTEIGVVSLIDFEDGLRPNGEWRYMQWRKGLNMVMLDTSDPDVKELIVQPAEDSPSVIDSENPYGFQTKDLWSEHPTKPGSWRHMGRTGDVTVLSNGEKTSNKQLQTILERDKKIAHAVVFGAGRPQNGVLLSPAAPEMSFKPFIDDIWPTVEELNRVVPKHSRLARELVLVEEPQRRFALTDKGTVREKVTLDLYQQDIEKAYDELENNQGSEVQLPTSFDAGSLTTFLRENLNTILPDGAPGDDADIFEHGMDSLLAVRLRSLIVKLAKSASASTDIPKNLVYNYPSINSLVGFLASRLSASESGQNNDSVQERVDRSIKRFTAGFNPRTVPSRSTQPKEEGEFVVVTGTTGSLGSFIVATLLARPSVQRIYCLNRTGRASSVQRQLQGFTERGLDTSILEQAMGDRVKFFDVDLSDAKLGLTEENYEELRVNVTQIIHAAWLLNFNLILESFEKVHVAGVRHLTDLALASPRTRCPRFVFLSSIASVFLYTAEEKLPEHSMSDATIATGGYGMSKFVGERICDIAVKEAGLNATVVRIGQISGASQSGAWATTEYIPILFRSSFGLGCVPTDLPGVRWIPTDIAAHVVLQQTFTSQGDTQPILYFNLENPRTTPWSDVADALVKYSEGKLQRVSMAQWLDKVRQHGVEDSERVPAVRLLQWYEDTADILPMDVEKTLKIAPELDYSGINEGLLAKYLHYQGI